MSTKDNPGAFDYYAKAAPDEPMFVLLARDVVAPNIILAWIEARSKRVSSTDVEQIAEALECAAAMIRWRITHPPTLTAR